MRTDRQADGRTDMKLKSAFRNFVKARNKTRQSQKYFNNVPLLSLDLNYNASPGTNAHTFFFSP